MGDFVPFIVLGKHLRERGHRIIMAVNPAMITLAECAGLEVVACGRPFGPEHARREAASFDERGSADPSEALASRLQTLDLGRTFHELRQASAGADLLVSSSLQGVAGWVHEATSVPWITATIFSAEFPHVGPAPTLTCSDAQRAYWRVLFDYRNSVRREVGLPARRDDAWRDAYWSARRVLLASSPHFSRPWLDDRPQVRMTGFWFDDSPTPSWTPCAVLERFLDAGPPPLVLTLSSLPVADPARVVTLHAEAAALLGARLIIQQGWAGLSRGEPPESAAIHETDLHFTGDVPHSWLFPRCSAVIQHGGIGTTAQALRCGRPMLVEPYGNDQHFNAGRIAALGVGAAVDHRLLTSENLADALARFVLTGEARAAADELRRAIDSEHGVTRACDLIEAELAA
jgi:UDP:flavonoid glycosyltransferase YjiC (YdhE family)